MENEIKKEANESFESVIESLTHFVNCTLNLSERYLDIFLSEANTHDIIEYEIHKYWNDSQNLKTLHNYVKLLKRITDKKIEEALPDGSMNNWGGHPTDKDKRRVIKIIINHKIAFITNILERQKILSAKTEYFNYDGKPQKMRSLESELINAQLIERTIYFFEIFQGKAPNERINWIGTTSSFSYFINYLFNTDLFKHLTHKWIIAENTFTIKGNPIPKNIRTYKDKDVGYKTKRTIKDAVFSLND